MSETTPSPIDPNADYREVCKRLADETEKTGSDDEEDQQLSLVS